MSAHLEQEIETYNARLPELLTQEGRFVLIHAREIVDFFDTYGDALKAGYKTFKLSPFLVKRIAPMEQTLFFTRDFLCHQ
ncbi:MAG: hypothetical protein LBU11_06285 [Zoogloeaceae bacterium]|jgi:hypothetical protein|nr:hypothetical protein [Zoogloeaceae bacterium]